MKWEKKGHQFNEIAKIILDDTKEFYIWGAGVAGEAFYKKKSTSKIKIKAFIDSDHAKIGTKLFGKEIFSPDILKSDQEAIVIIATLDFVDKIEETLISMQYQQNYTFFYSHVILSVLKMYTEKKLYMHHLNVHVTDICTYKCLDCSLFMAQRQNPQNINFNEIKRNLDFYFQWVDFVQELHLIGGEPLLNPDLPEIVEYIGEKYDRCIHEFAIATNGTILPSDKLLINCKKYQVFFTISDYSKSPVFNRENKIIELCVLLKKYGIKYRIGDKNQWFDFGDPTQMDQSNVDEEHLIQHFDRCFFRNRVMHHGRLYYCHRQVAAVWAGLSVDDCCSYFDLQNYDNEKIQELMEFDLGYNELGYLPFCNGCNGYERVNKKFIDAAKQAE